MSDGPLPNIGTECDTFRAEQQERRQFGKAKQHEKRLENANDRLVQVAYESARDEIIAKLAASVRERDSWIAVANDETREFWAKLRARGIPDRPAERDAYYRLLDEIREIGSRDPA